MAHPVAPVGLLLAVVALTALGASTAGAEGRADLLGRSRVGFDIRIVPGSEAGGEAVVVRYQGPIEYPLAANLEEIAAAVRGRFADVTLEIDSEGGSLAEAEAASAVLRHLKQSAALTTLVRHGRRCLSACVLVFAQGARRVAAGATVWMFHGACGPFGNRPSDAPTRRFVAQLGAAGIAAPFLCALADGGYLSAPGKLWLSGYELFHVHKANVLTGLLEPWQGEPPADPPFDPQIRSR